MISRRAQLKSQDQKVSSSLTDDFTMRNFIAVSKPPHSPLPLGFPARASARFLPTGSNLIYFSKNPSFMQETAYEPLTLNIPLLGRSTEEISRDPEPAIDTDVAVEDEDEDEQRAVEAQLEEPTTEEQLPFKKRRVIRFAE